MQALRSKWKIWIIIPLVAALIVGIFFACGRSTKVEEIPPADWTKSFTAKADIRFGDLNAVASVNRIGDGICDITLISPQALNGMKFQYNGSDISISYLGMNVSLNEDGLLANAMTAAIVKAVDTAARGSGISAKKKGKAILLNGTNDTGEFTLRMDKENGSLLSLEIPAIDLECTFGSADEGGEG